MSGNVSFNTVFLEHRDAVYRFAWRMTGSPSIAEDLTQDCFITLLHLPERFDPVGGAMRAFLIGIARNLILKRWRSENRWEDLNDDCPIAIPPHAAQWETAEWVARAVAALPPLQRETLILAQYEEMSLAEIACAVNAELSTVKARLHRARENLRRLLAPLRPPARSTHAPTIE